MYSTLNSNLNSDNLLNLNSKSDFFKNIFTDMRKIHQIVKILVKVFIIIIFVYKAYETISLKAF